ncbi:hypothetical protein ZEAMMB73_Zm00001d015151 [Zea mays]|uniref:Pre-rRNA-processing protein RIX1 N-terminal domain-containing protein n=1 Tax=Zea mays TaxID=4577 RepID=A0A1D6GZL0_MAIZE|nr:hypothetical protein ZEAMMB73_Zm00001d015151 [Zea mays]
MAAGSGGGGFLGDVNDPWLKPRLLRAVVTGRLPQPGAAAELSPTEVASILEVVRTHGLLTEDLPGRGALVNPKLAEAWRAAVDAWVERVVALVESDSVGWLVPWSLLCPLMDSASFSIHGQELKLRSFTNMLVSRVDNSLDIQLLVGLAKFSNLKKEGSSFAGRVVEPVLRLLNQNGLVADEAIDLLRTVIKLYPSSVNRHYNKVESAIAAKIMSNVKPSENSPSLTYTVSMLQKFARTLALLPSVRVSEDSWSLMIRRILIVVNNLLNDAFIGLEEEKKGHDIMLLLVPPGTDPLPTLGDEVMPGGNVHIMKKFRVFTVPTISALTLCCSVMLTSYYPVQVNVPIHALIALMRRVLLVDGSLHNKLFPSTTSLHQELICFDLPSLHSTFLDLLNATIKGMRSQLLPHGASIIRLITEYFKIAKLPTLRTKTYSILQLLLTSMGVGTSLHLLEATVRNAVADLNDDGEINMTMINTNSSQLTNESSSKVYSKKRKQEPQMQNSTISGSEKVAISPRKRKGSSIPITSKGVAPESTGDVTLSTPHSVKIAALETLEVLLNVGGSLRMDRWRSEVDMLLINVARSACGMGGSYEQKPSTFGEPNISDFQLASLKGLLASFLSSHARPPYLANGIELFRKGKLEIGTKVAEFCSHALLALDVLVHPRALSLERTVPASSGFNYTAQKKTVFGAGTHQISPFGDQPQAMEVEDMYDDWLISNNNEPPEVPVNGSDAVVSKGVLVEDGKQLNPIAEDPKVDPPRITDAAQDAPASTKTDVKVVDAAAATAAKPNTAENPSSSNAVPSPVRTTDSDSRKHASFPEQDSPHENKSAAVHPGEASATPGVGSSHHRHEAPEARSASFTELFGSESGIESESEDLMPDIVDGDPDSD